MTKRANATRKMPYKKNMIYILLTTSIIILILLIILFEKKIISLENFGVPFSKTGGLVKQNVSNRKPGKF